MKLFWKIFVSMFISFVVIVFSISYFISVKQIAEVEKRAIEEKKIIGSFLSKEIEVGYFESKWPFESLKKLSGHRGVLFWWIVRDDGTIHLADNASFMGTYAQDYFPQIVSMIGKENISLNRNQNYGIFFIPLETGKKKWSFWFGFSLKEVSDRRKEVISLVTAASMSVLLMLGAILYFAIKHFTKPIQELTVSAETIGKGDLAHRVKIESKDELGQLARSFNKMTEDLQKTTVSKDYVDNIIESMIDALIVLNPDTKIRMVNKATCELLGYQEEELIGKPVETIFSKTEEEIAFKELENLTKGEELKNYETYFKTKDGKKIPILFNGSVMKDKDGNVNCMVCTARDITERKRAEEALLNAAQQWRTTFDGISDIVCLLDSEGKILRCNKAMVNLFGKPFSEIVGRPYWEIVHGRTAPIKECPVVRMKETRHKETTILPIGERWFNIAVDPLLDEAGSLLGAVHIMSDITELKKGEETLRLLEKAIETLSLGLTIVDEQGKIIYTNPAEAEMHGYQVEELIGNDVRILAPREIWNPMTVGQLLKMNSWKRETINIRKDGSTFPVYLLSVVVPNVQGDALGVITTCEDISERKRAEDALRRSEEKYRTILENIEEGYYEVDIAGNFTLFNDSICRIWGYPEEELMGMNNRQYTDQENAKKLFQAFNKVYRTGEPTIEVGWEIIRKDGTKRYIEASASLLKDSSGKPTGFRGIIRDITERKQAEKERAALQEQLRQSQKMEAVGQLAGGIAHDFNNLLTVIQGYSELILNSLDQSSRLRQDVQEIMTASERASSLTRQLLAFSRKQVLQPKVLDFNTHVSNMDKMLHRMIGEDIELVTLLAKDLGRIKADPGQIEQVILNLAVNAKDAMLNGGKLTIETANVKLDESYARSHIGVTPGHYVMLSVSDNGVGMTSEIKERIFEPFFTTKEKGKGTGLGLSTVYGIIQQSGGNVWVYSEPGVGTTFKIYLPTIEEDTESLRPTALSTKPKQGFETILLVEDEEMVRKLACTVLQKYGYTVLEAPNGKEALRIVQGQNGNPIHLMVTDVVMPGMSGRQLAERLMSLRPEMKVLYMSGYTDNAIVHHGVLDPGIAYIQKPFAPDALASKVREILDAH